MRRTVCVVLLGLAALAASQYRTAEMPALAIVLPDRVLIAFCAGIPADEARAIVEAAGGRLVEWFGEIDGAVAAPASVDVDTLIAVLRSNGCVVDAESNTAFEVNDPSASDRTEAVAGDVAPQHPGGPLVGASYPDTPDWFYTSTPAQWSVKRVGAKGGPFAGTTGPGAWDTTRGAGVKIAIVDSGVSSIHPDIAPNLVAQVSVVGPDPTPCDDGSPEDQVGHGTWTASLAAGAIGGGLVIGVAPEAKIISVKTLVRIPAPPPDAPARDPGLVSRCNGAPGSAGVGTAAWVLDAVLEANRLGADIISMSISGFLPRNAPASHDQPARWVLLTRATNYVTRHGSLVIAAAGNDGLDLDRERSWIVSPADLPNVISVVATTNPECREDFTPDAMCSPGPDALAFYSNFGSSLHGLAAPGGTRSPGKGGPPSSDPSAKTAFVVGGCSPGIPGRSVGLPSQGGSYGCLLWGQRWYVQMAGTSAAGPHAAGVAALIKAAHPSMTPAQVRAVLERTAENIGAFRFFNFGLVDARAAVLAK